MHNRIQNHFHTREVAGETPSVPPAVERAFEELNDSQSAVRRATSRLAAHPAVAIGAAFAVGLLIGKWVKR